MINPESNPILVLDFGAQYSKLIARHATTTGFKVTLLTGLIFLSVACPNSRTYSIEQVSVRDSEGKSIPLSQNAGLTIERDGYALGLSFYFSPRTPNGRWGKVCFNLTITNSTNTARSFSVQSFQVTPLKFKNLDGTSAHGEAEVVREGPVILLVGHRKEDGPDTWSYHKEVQVESNSEEQFAGSITVPYVLTTGRCEMTIAETGAMSSTIINFEMKANGII